LKVKFNIASMLVCHCHTIGHRRVLEVVREGCRTTAEVMRACGAGRSCGGCAATVCELIDQVAEEEAEARSVAAAPPAQSSEAPTPAQGFIGM
jgi:bacterioferritin-associated ferredoxin